MLILLGCLGCCIATSMSRLTPSGLVPSLYSHSLTELPGFLHYFTRFVPNLASPVEFIFAVFSPGNFMWLKRQESPLSSVLRHLKLKALLILRTPKSVHY